MTEIVSVCMATYNGKKYIRKQIDSILSQLKISDELVISDDGSDDGTLDIIKSFNDSRIKLFHHRFAGKKPRVSANTYYATSNFEYSLNQAKGDYIFLSDQDDIWCPNKVELSITKLKETNAGVLMSILNVINGEGEIIQRNPKKSIPSFIKGIINRPYHGSAMVIERSFLNKALPFPKLAGSHDLWIGILATLQNKFVILNEPVLLYRRHGENATWNVKNPLWYKLSYRIYYVYAAIKRTYFE
jgi:glycosyltransferase involved in cell wall biosynthesis